MLRCSQAKYLGLDRIDIVDGHVEVKLLRPVARGPGRRGELLNQLERQAHTVHAEDDPVVVGGRDFPADDSPVELSQGTRIGTVQNDRSHSSQCHGHEFCHVPTERLPDAVTAASVHFLFGPLAKNARRVDAALRTPFAGQWRARRGEYRVRYRIDDREQAV